MTERADAVVVVASDAFKGSLTSAEVGDAVRLGVLDVLPRARVVVVPVADGGEGTVAAAVAAGWRAVSAPVHGPTGEPVTATLAVRGSSSAEGSGAGPGSTVLVEMADACGLARLPGGIRAPLTASSRGLGEAIRAALDLNPTELVVGVGGSASTDGGAGVLAALGGRLLDADGRHLPDGGAALARIARLDLGGLDPRLSTVRLVLAADVDSPLLGPSGAAAVFAPQKGASPQDVAELEVALTRWSEVVTDSAPLPPSETRSTNRSKLPQPQQNPSETRSTNWSKLPQPHQNPSGTGSTYWSKLPQRAGAGAAGGVGFALMTVLGAERRSGVEVVLDLVGLDSALTGADLLVTGEGSIDAQSLSGKAVGGVARRAARHGIPVVAVCGRAELDDAGLAALGVRTAYPLSDLEPDVRRSMRDARALLRRSGSRIAEEWLRRAPE